jgi:hypothetical protein
MSMTATISEERGGYTASGTARRSADTPGATSPALPAGDTGAPAVPKAGAATSKDASAGPAHARSRVRPPSSIIHPRTLPPANPAGAVPPPPRLTEGQLSALWRGQRFPAGALVTRQGVPVRVIFPGRPGRGAGPDFRGALIAGPSGVQARGDVELHVRSSLFRAHGHGGDAAYANVVLHVVFEDDTGEDTPLPGGGRAPVVALAPWVATRARELEAWLVRPQLWREPCHDAVGRLGKDGVIAALDAEGARRFDAKAARFAAAAARDGTAQALYAGLLEAMGYGGNAAGMAALARLLPWARLELAAGDGIHGDDRRTCYGAAPDCGHRQRRDVYEALLLGSAGLLPTQRSDGPAGGGTGAATGAAIDDAHIATLEAAFAAARLPSLGEGAWKLWGVRPENAPARRIAGAAALLARLASPTEMLAIAGLAEADGVVAALRAEADGYWRDHYDAGSPPCRLPPAIVGRSRALEIAVNVVLPAAAACGDAALAAAARALYARLPRPAAYGATRFIEEALASDGRRVPITARRAQGLLALQRDWCSQGGCGRCALSERLEPRT